MDSSHYTLNIEAGVNMSIMNQIRYIRRCQHCDAENSYGLGYYRCSECEKMSLPIVEVKK
jgi:hypothetical protein